MNDKGREILGETGGGDHTYVIFKGDRSYFSLPSAKNGCGIMERNGDNGIG